MYVQHFGLEHEPFSIAPDPRYLYLSERHREALAHLTYGLGAGGGVVLLTGEIGAGKTTVCRCFLEQVPVDCRIAYIFNPKLTVIELLASVCEEFGVAVPASPGEATIKTYLDPLNRFLLQAHAAGRNSVLVIDEAQLLSPDVLEQLRLLTNLETSERKLLQIILVGQPELRDMLAQPGLEQLAQRVIARYHLGPLDEADTALYLQHRLELAGLRGPSPLGPSLIRSIHRYSGGLPRRINRLCDRALLGAFGQGLSAVDLLTLRRAVQEVEGSDRAYAPWKRRRAIVADWGKFSAGAAVGAVLVGAGLLAWMNRAAELPHLEAMASGQVTAEALAEAGAASARAETALAAASAGLSAAAAGTPITLAQLGQALSKKPVDEQAAWRGLAGQWGAALGDGDACLAAAQLRLGCFRGQGGLRLVRQLGRPGVLPVRVKPAGEQHVQIVGLDARHATLLIGGQRRKLSLIDLATIWEGGFATFWRVPEALLREAPADGSEPLAPWLSQRLAGIDGESARADIRKIDDSLRQRLLTFQRAQGLEADGVPGPMTLMALNRATGIDEPRLASER